MSVTPLSSRQTYIDWLRIFAIIGVLLFHSAMPYVAGWEWHIKNPQTSNTLLELNDFMSRWRMPLLFFISGAVSYFMLQRYNGSAFLGQRFLRLFVPLIVGILVIVPPQIYLERVVAGYQGNFWQFYLHMFKTGAYPKGDLSWHHLWFICYLLVYDILLTPLFVHLMSKGRKLMQRLEWLAKGSRIYLLALPGVLVYTFWMNRFRATHDLIHDYGYFPYYLFFVLVGFICIANQSFMDSLARNRRTSFAIAVLSILIINYCRWNKIEPWFATGYFNPDYRFYLFAFVGGVNAYMWVFTAVGYGKQYLNRPWKGMAYVNQAVYPFYILHQTVIVILTFYLVKVPDPIGMKYIFTVIVTFLLSMCIFHLFIRPFAVMRFLFGMKGTGRKKEKKNLIVHPVAVTVL
jgi:peptidoglycan/LPS O-acetylase OafA/YrhL